MGREFVRSLHLHRAVARKPKAMSTNYEYAIALANHWRCQQAEGRYLTEGVVRIYAGGVYGWCQELGDPGHEHPGSLAVDAGGHVFEAVGGNGHAAAAEWDEIERPAPRPRGPGM